VTGEILKAPLLERLLAGLLHSGSTVASTVIAVGVVLAMIDSRLGTHNLAVLPNTRLVTIGIALFILLPTLRVLLMLIVFVRQRDYRFTIIAALVLTIILLGFLFGIRTSPAVPA
jgi:uncharacterized membrane protein